MIGLAIIGIVVVGGVLLVGISRAFDSYIEMRNDALKYRKMNSEKE